MAVRLIAALILLCWATQSFGFTAKSVAFVVFYSHPEIGSVFDAGGGVKARVPDYAHVNLDSGRAEWMIHMNFESARLTHSGCRLVVLTDTNTTLNVDTMTPAQRGPAVEVVRVPDLNPKEEMISRQKARIHFLESEKGTHNLVFLDTDMLVVKSIMHVFQTQFDMGVTWRHDVKMPINGGILFVRSDKVTKALDFFRTMYMMTTGYAKGQGSSNTRRWFGQSDQVALGTIAEKTYGWTFGKPGTPTGIRQLKTTSNIRTVYLPKVTPPGSKPESQNTGYNMYLLSCELYNGSAAKRRDRKAMCFSNGYDSGCCCSADSHILHFKGGLKFFMKKYYRDACTMPMLYQCATIKTKCMKGHG